PGGGGPLELRHHADPPRRRRVLPESRQEASRRRRFFRPLAQPALRLLRAPRLDLPALPFQDPLEDVHRNLLSFSRSEAAAPRSMAPAAREEPWRRSVAIPA